MTTTSKDSALRERLTGVVGGHNRPARAPQTTRSSGTAKSAQDEPGSPAGISGPWGHTYPIKHYKALFASYFSGKIDNPIDQAQIKHYLSQFSSVIVESLSGRLNDKSWEPVANAVLLSFKLSDELDRMRRIKGQHLEHLDAIRELFRLDSVLLSNFHEPLREFLKLHDGDTRLDDQQLLQLEAYEQATEHLLRTYSQFSDFTNLLIPGAVAIDDENRNYAKGAFRQAISKKARQVRNWAVRRQRYLVVTAILLILGGGAYHASQLISFRKKLDTAALNAPFNVLSAYSESGHLVLVIPRNSWTGLKKAKRETTAATFFERIKKNGYVGLKIVDEKQRRLVQTLSNGEISILSFAMLPEDSRR